MFFKWLSLGRQVNFGGRTLGIKGFFKRSLKIGGILLTGLGVAPSCFSNGPGGTFAFTISGEKLALEGYDFSKDADSDTVFIDGYEVKFTRLLVTVDNLSLSLNPDFKPSDPLATGKKVAEVKGPFAVDLHKGGPLLGKGGDGEQALPLATLSRQNLNGDQPFSVTERYAFGFDIVPASKEAQLLNLDAEALADYQEMINHGWTVLYVGVATARGQNCLVPAQSSAYDFASLPAVVRFRLGFKSPTSYLNCQNPDNAPATPLPGEEEQRGVQAKANQTVTVQLTIHTDHPFWDHLKHGSSKYLHFDQLAARAKCTPAAGGGTPDCLVTLEDLKGVDFTDFKDLHGKNLTWRNCLGKEDFTDDSVEAMQFQLKEGVAFNPTGEPDKYLRDYYDYLTYLQSSEGHLNADGLCAVQRNYVSPP